MSVSVSVFVDAIVNIAANMSRVTCHTQNNVHVRVNLNVTSSQTELYGSSSIYTDIY